MTDPNGDEVLSERFDPDGGAALPPDGSVSDDQTARYDDVFTSAGTYWLSVDVDSDAVAALEAERDVTSPGDEHLLIAIESDQSDDPIAAAVAEDLDDVADW